MNTYLIEVQIDFLKRERQYLIERKSQLLMQLLKSGIKQFDDEIAQYNCMIGALKEILNQNKDVSSTD